MLLELRVRWRKQALGLIKTASLSPNPCRAGLLLYFRALALSIPVYPAQGFQGDVSETQIRLQHHFRLKFFRDCFCLQEKLKLLDLAFEATRSLSPHS